MAHKILRPAKKQSSLIRDPQLRRQMAAVQEKMNPEYFLWVCDQGYLPFYEVKKQLELFGTKVMPEFMG